ncbi:MAG TPA: NAD(P)-binding domain-containing protein [Actinomycetota bacterium]|nr:NAD(P)-binding domain-containing protein [Actinomycetota bacterium]
MARVAEQPHPPGDYPAVVVGSGPGGIQLSYSLTRLGVRHAFLSADEAPAGMFRRFPFFQRLISWTKPYAPHERGTRPYQRFDWNSLIGDEPEHNSLVPRVMDGTSSFPSREEMERGLTDFVRRTKTPVRFDTRWETTRREENGFAIGTSDGEYRAKAFVCAVGMTEAWRPVIPGLDKVPHYVDISQAKSYANKTVVIIGKRNSGFEIADGILPWARKIVLVSPRPTRLSILVYSPAAARARYMQPYEEHALGSGGVFVVDAAIQRVQRTSKGWKVHASGTTTPGDLVLDADEVIAATGFGTPLRDLPDLGVKTFFSDRLPSQTPWWESATVPGVFFAGSITQGSIGLKKYGQVSTSAAVHGFRYNAVVLARHLAETRFGIRVRRPKVRGDRVVPFLLKEATEAPELWNQRSYLCRVVLADPSRGIVDEGITPLAHFVDGAGPDGVAITVEVTDAGVIQPAVYVRSGGDVEEHILETHPLLDFRTPQNHAQLAGLVKGIFD